jgi:hypothetical protein
LPMWQCSLLRSSSCLCGSHQWGVHKRCHCNWLLTLSHAMQDEWHGGQWGTKNADLTSTTSTHSIVTVDLNKNVHPIHHPTTTWGVGSYFGYSLPTSAEFGGESIPSLKKCRKRH